MTIKEYINIHNTPVTVSYLNCKHTVYMVDNTFDKNFLNNEIDHIDNQYGKDILYING